MNGNFERCMAIVADWEGGWSDHPADNGGATMYGITISTLRAWRGKPVTKDDVRKLTKTEALRIYRAWYWQPVRGDDLPAGLDLAVYDLAVNSGPSRAARFLQGVLRVQTDGVIGSRTVSAAQAANVTAAINMICDNRLAWLRGLDDWPHFGKGWTNRVEDIRRKALDMARPQIADPPRPKPKPAPDPEPKPSQPRMPENGKEVGIFALLGLALVAIWKLFGG